VLRSSSTRRSSLFTKTLRLAERTLVTGALGCLGTWTIKALLAEGKEPVGYDVGSDKSRLWLVLDDDELERVTFVQGDITNAEALGDVLDEHAITHVVHLAALQVPSCRADPVAGAKVNVLGTTTVFEAVKERRERIAGLAYASSTAVYNGFDPSPAPESGGTAPSTLYGVYKLANEGTARIFWEDGGVASIGIRPYVVYGAGRDQGLTSGPSLAMAAAARGEGFEIGYGGTAQYDFAADVGQAFARASRAATEGAHVANFPGAPWSIEDMVAAIETAAPDIVGQITWVEDRLPFPESLEATLLERLVGPLPETPLAIGVRRTIEHFRRRP
jgi:UDP-glucuronate 4-epimerase